MKNLKQLLGICEHKWEIYSENEIHQGGKKVGYKYHLRCKKCGDIKKAVA